MKFCIKCVNPSTRPNISFDEEGLCPVCQHYAERKAGKIDWEGRKRELKSLLEWSKQNTNGDYDCIIGVSGGKDSVRQSFYARDVLQLRPLLVSCLYPPEQMVERGAKNLENLVSHGFDILTVGLDPISWKESMKHAFFHYANWCKSTELPLYAIPVHMAIAFKIPLIFLGENPKFSIGESHGSETWDATRMKYCNTLQGGNPKKIVGDKVKEESLYFYTYPSDHAMESHSIRIAYLGYFIEDFNSFKNAEFAIERGLTLRSDLPEENGDITGTQSLDEDFYPINQYLKKVKFGYGQVTDKVCEAINLGIMTRQKGVELVKKYDGSCSEKYINKFLNYLEITRDEFEKVVDDSRNHKLWERDVYGNWKLRYDIK